MQITRTKYDVTVPAGTYFLGDPCYAVPDKDWMPLLESCGYFDANRDGTGSPVGTVRGFEVLSFGTKYGDGVYRDQFGKSYPVDAGMIGLTPVALVKDMADKSLGQIVTFDRPTICHEDDGVLTFGHIVINTRDDDEDDWDGWDDEEE